MKFATTPLVIVTLIPLLCRNPIPALAAEPSLQQWFTSNSYITNVATDEMGIEAFSAGHYRVTILTEIAHYAPNNTFGWYSTTTGTFHELFSGENTTDSTVEFSSTERFALYLGSPEGTFHTENSRNVDEFDHAWVFQDPKTEDGYIIAWEDLLNGGDEDYQDMILSIRVLQPPQAAFSWFPHYPQVKETVAFNASDSTPDGGYVISYQWDFGDDNTTTTDNPITTHTYHTFGNYTVTLNITDSEGKTDSVYHPIMVRASPYATFTHSPPNPQVDEQVVFNASDSTPDGGYVISYQWDFGDDNTTTTDNPITTHTYHTFGNYTVTLNITDSEGKWDAESITITVQRPIPESQFVVKIEDEWTSIGDEYEFTAPTYCKTFKAEVRIINVLDLFGYEFWIEFDPDLIQLTEHEIKHVHTEYLVTLEEIDNTIGVYKQAVNVKTPAETYNGSAPVATLWFHIMNDPCYPYNYTSILKLNNTGMIDSHGSPIIHILKHGYFNILSVRPEISIEHEGETETTTWMVNETFTVDIIITDIFRMKGFFIQLGWCDGLETDYQNVQVTSFLPQPYKVQKTNINDTMLTVQVETFAEKPAINGTGTLLRVTFKARNPWSHVPPYMLSEEKYVPENYTCEIWIMNGWIEVYCPEHRRMDLYNSSYGVGVENTFTYTFTPIPGDLNLDGKVDTVDLSTISGWAGFESGDPEWTDCQYFDLNGDEVIDIFDIVIVATNLGRTHP